METLLAQKLSLPGQTAIEGPSGFLNGESATLGTILSRALPIIFIFAGIGLFLMILASGFTLMTSAGDAKKMEAGKQRLTNAILGFIIIFASFWIVQIFGTMFGLDSLTGVFG